MNPDEMNAGRKLDRLIAARVMGLGRARYVRREPFGSDWMLGTGNNVLPHYSTDIAAAWEVREELFRRGLVYDVTLNGRGPVYCEVERPDSTVWFTSEGDTAPLAICRAALKVAAAQAKAAGA